MESGPRSPAFSPDALATGRTSLVLSASQIEFLERLCARLRRDGGGRFTKALLLRVLVAVLAESPIPYAEIQTETHLKEWLRSPGTSGAAPSTAGTAWPSPAGR